MSPAIPSPVAPFVRLGGVSRPKLHFSNLHARPFTVSLTLDGHGGSAPYHHYLTIKLAVSDPDSPLSSHKIRGSAPLTSSVWPPQYAPQTFIQTLLGQSLRLAAH